MSRSIYATFDGMAQWNKQGIRQPPKLCDFKDCGRPQRNRGLCNAHAQQRRRGVELFPIGPRGWKSKGRQRCSFNGCDRFNHSGGLCSTHSAQKRRGVPLRAIRAPKPQAEAGLRWCASCCQFRDTDEFGWDSTRGQPKRTCRPCHADRQLAYTRENRERLNMQRRLKNRGISENQYRQMLENQHGRCAICDKERSLDIDHCHSDGHVRALLCSGCNRGLAAFRDDPEAIDRAAAYLRGHRSGAG